jgi:hypothetical protein
LALATRSCFRGACGSAGGPTLGPAGKPKGKARKGLNKKRKATLKARATYSPRDASPKREVKTITLVKGRSSKPAGLSA